MEVRAWLGEGGLGVIHSAGCCCKLSAALLSVAPPTPSPSLSLPHTPARSPSTAPSRTRRSTCGRWWWATSTTRACTVRARHRLAAVACAGGAVLPGCSPAPHRCSPAAALPLHPTPLPSCAESLLREYCDLSKHGDCIGDAMIGEGGAAAELGAQQSYSRRRASFHPPSPLPLLPLPTSVCPPPRLRHRHPGHAQGGPRLHPLQPLPRAALRVPHLPAAPGQRRAGGRHRRARRFLQAPRLAGGARLLGGLVLPGGLQVRQEGCAVLWWSGQSIASAGWPAIQAVRRSRPSASLSRLPRLHPSL